MNRFRAILLAAGVSVAAAGSAPAAAQIDGAIVLNILRECAKINDANARLACYDNNIRSAGSAPQASQGFGLPQQNRNVTQPSQQAPSSAPSSAPSVAAAPANAGGFGSETLRTTRAQTQSQREDGITAAVAQISEREPGIYLLTFEDGAQWLFAEGVNRSYKVPRRGDVVEISRASLGSFTMRFNNQSVVRVRRVR